jgi:hypothetical protein
LLLIFEHRILNFAKIKAPMRACSDGINGESKEGDGKPAKIYRLLWPRLVEFWILMAIVVFFLIRVLGSHTSQRLLSGFARRHFL